MKTIDLDPADPALAAPEAPEVRLALVLCIESPCLCAAHHQTVARRLLPTTLSTHIARCAALQALQPLAHSIMVALLLVMGLAPVLDVLTHPIAAPDLKDRHQAASRDQCEARPTANGPRIPSSSSSRHTRARLFEWTGFICVVE